VATASNPRKPTTTTARFHARMSRSPAADRKKANPLMVPVSTMTRRSIPEWRSVRPAGCSHHGSSRRLTMLTTTTTRSSATPAAPTMPSVSPSSEGIGPE
jgi:hypothetical protein